MPKLSSVQLLWLICVLCLQICLGQYCNEIVKTPAQQKQIPPNTWRLGYSAHIQAVFGGKKSVYYGQIQIQGYASDKYSNAKIRIENHENRTEYIKQGKFNKLYIIKTTNYKTDKANATCTFGDNNKEWYQLSKYLTDATTYYKLVKQPDAIVDDLPVEHWRQCITWKRNQEFWYDLYLTESKAWKTSSNESVQVPVRATVVGANFNHTYEYFDFKITRNEEKGTYEVPEGVTCAFSRNATLPTLPNVMIYDVEEITRVGLHGRETYNAYEMYYDSNRKLARYSQPGLRDTIVDFNSAIKYYMYHSTGYCLKTTLLKNDPYIDVYTVEENGKTVMKSPIDFAWFLNASRITYNGKERCRNETCDVWTVDTFFSGWNYNILTYRIGANGPISYTVKKIGYSSSTSTYNFFAFHSVETNIDPKFDVSTCYEERDTLVLRLAMTVPKPDYILYGYYKRNVVRQVKFWLIKLISEVGQISLLRVNVMDVIMTADTMYAIVHIYPVAAHIGYSKRNDNHWAYTLIKAGIPREKLDFHIHGYDRTEIRKGLFIMRPGTQKIFPRSAEIMSKDIDEIAQNSIVLNHYNRYENRKSLKFKPKTSTVVSNAEDCAKQCEHMRDDTFTCRSVEYCYSTKTCGLSDYQPEHDKSLAYLTYNDGCDLFTRKYLQSFVRRPGRINPENTARMFNGLDHVERCAKLCLEENEFDCLSFDFCPVRQQCYISRRLQMGTPDVKVTEAPQCSHYKRNHGTEYEHDYQTKITDKEDVLLSQMTQSDCATACSTATDFTCRSYSYDSMLRTCGLYKRPVHGAGKAKTTGSLHGVVGARIIYNTGGTMSKGATASQVSSDGTYSQGSMVGLGVVMLVVGLVIGAVLLILAVRRQKANHGGFMSSLNVPFT